MRLILTLIILCVLNAYAFGKDKVSVGPQPGWIMPIKPDPGKIPPARDISNGFYYVLIDEETNLATATQYFHSIKKIVNEKGIQGESEVSVSFSPEYQQLQFHSINIIRDGKLISQLSPGAIKVIQEEKDASEYQYNGIKRAFVTLKDVRRNDLIEVAYSLTGMNPVFGKKYSDEFYFTSETAVGNYYKTIITTPDRKLIIRTSNNAPAPDEKTVGDKYLYRWENPPLKVYESTSNAPSWYIGYPKVEITEYHSWEEVVNWGLAIFKNYQYPLPADLRKKIEDWKKTAAGDQDLFANIATHFVQDEVRYLGLEIGANTHQPHPPADVYAHRFGDCKDKALLLATILHEDGIPAYAALINTDMREKLSTLAPSSGAFDHVIVAIGRSLNEFLFVDPTISGQRGELINRYVPAYGYSLILKPGETQLRKVDPPFLYSFNIEETLDVKKYDSSTFTAVSTYAGGAADRIRNSFAGSSIKEIEDNYRDYYSKIYDGIRMTAPLATNDDSVKDEFTVTEAYTIPQIFHDNETKGRRSMDFEAGIINEYLPSPPKSARGDAPLALSFPRTVNYTARINMPEEWGFDIEELHVKNDSYQFDFTPSVGYSTITVHYYFKSFKDHIPAAALEQYKTDYEAIMGKVSFQLYENITPSGSKPSHHNTAPSTGPSFGPAYWPAIWLSFFIALFATWCFRRLNLRTAFTQHYDAYHASYQLGGWTAVLGVGLGLGMIWQLYTFFKGEYYSADSWRQLDQVGGAALRYLIFSDLAFSLLTIIGLGAIFYWYLKRRDIFPTMFTWYVGLLLIGQFILLIYSAMLPATVFKDGHLRTLTIQLVRSCFYGLGWVSYVQRSERVKGTFVHGPYQGTSYR